MSTISEKTKITLAVAIMMIGGASFCTTIYVNQQAQAQDISDLKAEVKQLASLATDVAVIKAEVHDVNRKVDKLDQ